MANAHFSFFMLASLFLFTSCIHAKCLDDQRSHMLQFRDGLQFWFSNRLAVNWNHTTDCCEWRGAACDRFGHVISIDLDLIPYSISIKNDKWKALFSLQHLRRLNLALYIDYYHPPTIPMEIYNLTRLEYLNCSGFSGPIPIGLSKLNSLVTLDLSQAHSQELLQVRNNGGLEVLFQNLTELRQVYLDGVSVRGWRNAFSSLPKLQVLSFSKSELSGSIFPSLSNLTLLTTIKLDDNTLKTTVPDFFANFTNLQILSLSNCDLHGHFPKAVFPELVFLDLSDNSFSGSIPSFQMSPKLAHVNMLHNSFTGPISSLHFEGLSHLQYVDLDYNSLSGNVPTFLFALPSLRNLHLPHNHFDGEIQEFPNGSSNVLEEIYLSNNNFRGFIPNFFFDLLGLTYLDISSNSFTGTLRLDMFGKSQNLSYLKLSHNNLSIDGNCSSRGCLSSLPKIAILGPASCSLQVFPDLRNLTNLMDVDLSLNNLTGKVPNWFWTGGMIKVNLSFNRLEEIQKSFTFGGLDSLVLSGNLLKGEIPLPESGSGVRYLDYSNNNFSTSIPLHISDYIPNIASLSLSNSNIHGKIPESLCNCSILDVVDFSYNFLTGTIPSCLPAMVGVLNLRENNLMGNISDTFNIYCPLQFLDLSRNNLTGKIPKSVANCTSLQIVDVGNNYLEDTFPCTLTNGSFLGILILRSNRFYGEINCSWVNHSWPSLQILDISYNNFSGSLPAQIFLNCRGMMINDNAKAPLLQYTVSEIYGPGPYQDSISLIIKELELELYKILTILKIMDFSSNHFQGKIPDSIGELSGLYSLNMSHNALTGTIPKSIGKLKQLGSLDFSTNELSGRIPSGLGDLTFLLVLNVSYNQLFGKIPSGCQLQTFSESSFLGNKGLCGVPLNLSCDHGMHNEKSSSNDPTKMHSEIDWEYLCAALGFSVGLGVIGLFNWLSPTWWRKFNTVILRFLIETVIGFPNQ